MSVTETEPTDEPDLVSQKRMAAILGTTHRTLTRRWPLLHSHGAARFGRLWHVEATRAAVLEAAKADMKPRRGK
jgi:hypothetical protein